MKTLALLSVLGVVLAGEGSDPGDVRYYKHNYRTGCDRWHNPGTACNCFKRTAPAGGPSGVFVDCSNLGLTDLMPPRLSAEPTASPTSWPTPATGTVDPEALVQTYPSADVFYANGNDLTHIRADTFGKQPNLKYLYLHNNPNLQYIEPGAFNNMTNLRELLLHYTALELLPAGIFDNLPRLKILWAHNTGQLHSIAPGVFSQLHSLEWLRLENNNLSMAALDYDASPLWPRNLEKLFLNGNERLVFHGASADEQTQACCALCGVSGKANVKADTTLPLEKKCKVTGKGNCDEKPKVQTLACCGPIDCGEHCSFEAGCNYWTLALGAGAATRANFVLTFAAVALAALSAW